MITKSSLLGIFTGLSIGVIVTLLSTPISGQELQNQCKNNIRKMKSNFSTAKKNTVVLKNQTVKTAKISSDTIKNVTLDITKSVNDWKKEVEPTVAQLHANIEELQQLINQTKQLK